MRNKSKLHWDIFDKKRLVLLPHLKFLKEQGFYLAGGTALALQISHRRSLDFDFYNRSEFDAQKTYQLFQQQEPKKLLLDTVSPNTLLIEFNNIAISAFYYNYPLVKPLVVSDYLNLASVEDIAAMKLIAIIQRGIKRDFIDLYFLSQSLGLEKIMDFAKKKYVGFNRYLACQALVYFKDAEEAPARRLEMLKAVNWEGLKKYFIDEVAKLKRLWEEYEK